MANLPSPCCSFDQMPVVQLMRISNTMFCCEYEHPKADLFDVLTVGSDAASPPVP